QSPAKTNSTLIVSPTIDEQRAAVMSSVAEAKRAICPKSTTNTYAPKQKRFNE
ncbi:UNVERIFIED_CONTAM: hypothetical protein HDU68_002894, partial [Siphonaria sp. JEL0065]